MSRLSFKVQLRDSTLEVDLTAAGATYRLESGSELTIFHDGESLHLQPNSPVSRPLALPFGQVPAVQATG